MHAPLATALKRVLMEEGRACLPGIGTLIVTEQPALVSLMEGKAVPPSARVSFNSNLVVDDGRLSRELAPYGSVDLLEPLRKGLSEGQTVTLEGIGKFYRPSGGEIRFAPVGDNFSKRSFGLPAVSVKQIVRKEKQPNATSPRPIGLDRQRPDFVAIRTDGDHSEAEEKKQRTSRYVAAGLGIGLLLLILFFIFGLDDHDEPAIATAPSRERVNVPPPPTFEADRVRPGPAPRLNEQPVAPPPENLAPAPAPLNTAVIGIGVFGQQRNVDKQTRRLIEAGYQPYTDRQGEYTRVGLRVTYDDPAELRRVLSEVRQRYTEDAFVMRVNGREQRPQ